MKIDTFDHKALLGPPKIPGLHPEDSAQMAITNLNNSGDNNATASKKSNKKKKKSASSGSSPAVKNQVDHQEQHENYVNFSSSNQNNTTTIKEGYVPQDEVPLYESKGKQLAKARETGPAIPGKKFFFVFFFNQIFFL